MIDQQAIEHIRTHGMFGISLEERRRILEDSGFRMGEPAEYVLIGGCTLPGTMLNAGNALRALMDHLQIDCTLLLKEYCCGWMPLGQPAVMAKNEEDIARSKQLSQEFVQENFRQAEALGAKSIVLFCAACEPSYTNNAGETDLEIISYSELLDRYFTGGRLDLEADYFAGCYRFRRRITDQPVDVDAATRLLGKIEGLKVNHLDNKLCCYIPPHLEQLVDSLKSKELITICNGCFSNLARSLPETGDHRVRLLPEILLDAVQGH